MSARLFCRIPPERRASLFSQIRNVMDEVDAIDRALAWTGESMAVDEALEEIITGIKTELKRAGCRSTRIGKRGSSGSTSKRCLQ